MDDNKLADSIEWLTSRRGFLTVAGSAAAAGLATCSVAAQEGSDDDENGSGEDGDENGDGAGAGDQDDDGRQPFTAIEFSNQTSDGTEIVVDAVTLSDGGYVAIHDARLFEGQVAESVIGVSEYLEPGAHYSVEVSLFDVPGGEFERDQLEGTTPLVPMPHMETSGNETYDFVTSGGEEDGPYTESGIPAVDAGFVTVDSEQSTDNGEADDDDEEDTAGDDNGEAGDDDEEDTAGDDNGEAGDDGEDTAGDDGEDTAGDDNGEAGDDDEEDTAGDDNGEAGDDEEDTAGDDEEEDDDDEEDTAGDDEEEDDDDTAQDEEEPTPFATIEFQNQSTGEGMVTIREVTLSEGGFVTLHDARLLSGQVLESVVGVSEYLEAGRHQSVEVTVEDPSAIAEVELPARPLLPMPHQDTNDNQQYDFVDSEGADDGPYTKAQQAVIDAGLVTVEE